MRCNVVAVVGVVALCWCVRADAAEPRLADDVLPLLKLRCVKCHGPAKQEGKLNLSTARGLARGGKQGASVVAGDLAGSRLWERVEQDEMPPDEPLPESEKTLLKAWIKAGAQGLPIIRADDPPGSDHWAFQMLTTVQLPAVRDAGRVRTPVDRFIQAGLEANGLSLQTEAERGTLLRRLAFDLTGLPPTPEELLAFLADDSPEAYTRMVERYLASPRYGERWGKYWLDAAGYADSNGYFNADSDRPLAYRYRDYVVRSFNQDKPFDQFLREQLAGDELAKFTPGQPASRDTIELLEATHYLRNGQDGSNESDGNPDEVRIDRYSALESTMQIIGSSVLGMTIQCAKCHAHKFEPITHQDYYRFQSVFFPAFDPDNWVKPNDRFVHAALPGEMERWEALEKELDSEGARLKQEFALWMREQRHPELALFHDAFDAAAPLAERWTNTAPGDDSPAGKVPVQLDRETAPAARRKEGALQIVEGNTDGDSWLVTKQAFDWTPNEPDDWIQATFDLVAVKLTPEGTAADRVGYLIAVHDFNDNSATTLGNILIDGHPSAASAVYLDYPGKDSSSPGAIGNTGYTAGHNYGVRITNIGGGKFKLEHLVDGLPEEKSMTLETIDLPDGGFGFEYCCGRSFIVDNVLIEGTGGDAKRREQVKQLAEEIKARRKALEKSVADVQSRHTPKPGKIAWVTDTAPVPPKVFLLDRGNYGQYKEAVEPAAMSALAEPGNPLTVAPVEAARSTGRRLAWANWVTKPGSRASALVARVQANRLWQHHFGRGLVATPGNLGLSGAPPSHPELLDWLADELVRSNWSFKSLHRQIVLSQAYRQSSTVSPVALKADPDCRLLSRYPLRRLDAEGVRDALLACSGELEPDVGGPYVPTTRNESGEVIVGTPHGAGRRSLYLYQRRTQVLTMLNLFDTPVIVFNCTERLPSTIPLQSLSLLNSDFAVARARAFAARLQQEAGPDVEARLTRAYLIAFSRPPTQEERTSARAFLEAQQQEYAANPAPDAQAESRAWTDLCQMLTASNGFLYVE